MSTHQIRGSEDILVFATPFDNMNYKIVLFIFCVPLIFLCCMSQQKIQDGPDLILSSHHVDQLDSLISQEQRKIVFFLQTSWCKFCKQMKQTTFRDQRIREMLNEQYYFVPFDSEQKEDVMFHDRSFAYQPTGRNSGTHELAAELGSIDQKLIYPTTVIMNGQYEIEFQYAGYLTGDELLNILKAARQN